MRWIHLALASQGLGPRKRFSKGVTGTLAAVEHLGYVRIDTPSVMERAHHDVLCSRVPDYSLQHLNELTSAGNFLNTGSMQRLACLWGAALV